MSLPSYYRHPYLGVIGVHYADDPKALTLRFDNEELAFTFVRDGELVDVQKRTTKCCLIRLAGDAIPDDELGRLDVDDGLAVRTIRPKPAEPSDDVLRPFPELGPDVGATDSVKRPPQPTAVA